jgi:hypothetical protein
VEIFQVLPEAPSVSTGWSWVELFITITLDLSVSPLDCLLKIANI